MSGLTRCNFCTLQDMRARYGDEHIAVRVDTDEDEIFGWGGDPEPVRRVPRVWVEVLRDGERIASFAELTDRCVC